ncbi:MAG: metallophosphoesterase [Thermoanaerobacteraceae bacterium]|nr:metallophosphoesterase [Thermoanaerobacteraceae bacterium]
MRLGVVSDSHKDIEALKRALKNMGPVDMLLHAGDMYSDVKMVKNLLETGEIYSVVGNCDLDRQPGEQLITVFGYKLYLTHGHLHGVKYRLDKLVYHAEEIGADVVVFGHTHVPYRQYWGDILLFNPGSVSRPRGVRQASYGIIEIIDSTIQAKIYYF